MIMCRGCCLFTEIVHSRNGSHFRACSHRKVHRKVQLFFLTFLSFWTILSIEKSNSAPLLVTHCKFIFSTAGKWLQTKKDTHSSNTTASTVDPGRSLAPFEASFDDVFVTPPAGVITWDGGEGGGEAGLGAVAGPELLVVSICCALQVGGNFVWFINGRNCGKAEVSIAAAAWTVPPPTLPPRPEASRQLPGTVIGSQQRVVGGNLIGPL